MEELLHIKTRIVKEYLSITLTPSNPVLHITGLYNVFKNYKKGMYYKNELKFYEEWNDEASEVLFRYDKEVQEICNIFKYTYTIWVIFNKHSRIKIRNIFIPI